MTKAYEIDDIKIAVSASSTSELISGLAVDTTGYNRARFILMLNNGTAGLGSLVATGGIWKCATSDGTYAVGGATSVAAVTSGVMSDSHVIVEIDIPTENDYPWLKMSSYSVAGTTIQVHAICQLYDGIHKPDSSRGVQQTVTV